MILTERLEQAATEMSTEPKVAATLLRPAAACTDTMPALGALSGYYHYHYYYYPITTIMYSFAWLIHKGAKLIKVTPKVTQK